MKGGGKEDKPKVSDFLMRLATHSRGIPLVAWAIWRHGMLVSEEEEVKEKASEMAETDRGRTIWIPPWQRMGLPKIPQGTGRCGQFILHLLLVHAGLPLPVLRQLIPFPEADILQGLYRFHAAGLVKSIDGLWRVTLLGYPEVRRYLYAEDFLVDDF